MSQTFTLSLLALAGVIIPSAYLSLCVWMFRRRVWWFTYLAFFFVFGAFGGWCFALAMSPSGLTAASIVFLITVAVIACLTSALVLQFKKQRGVFESAAMIGGYVYPVLIVVYMASAAVFFHSTK